MHLGLIAEHIVSMAGKVKMGFFVSVSSETPGPDVTEPIITLRDGQFLIDLSESEDYWVGGDSGFQVFYGRRTLGVEHVLVHQVVPFS